MEDEKIIAKGESLFEISWEVCNKVGGIYSVISSKAATMQKFYSKYILIGPYFKKKADEDFVEESIPKEYSDVFNELRMEGIVPHYGTWLIKGEPKAILFEFTNIVLEKALVKKELWESYGVDSLFSGWEFEEPLLFSWAAATFLQKLEMRKIINASKTLLHCHEWMTGFSILKLKKDKSNIKTIFTTHATMLGRSISSNSQDLYASLGKFDPYQKAKEIGVLDKFTAEKATARACDIFTTVSEITSKEAEFILGRKPEVLVLNGLDMDEFPSIEETSVLHVESRELIRELLAYTFFPYYQFNLNHNLSYFLAGRYEYKNKGMDIFIQALGKLNEQLKELNSDRTISVFFFMAMPNNGVKSELLENKNYYRHIKNYVQGKSHELMTKIVNDSLSNKNPALDLFSNDFLQEINKDVVRFKRSGTPVHCTHIIGEDESNNSIIKAFKENKLFNLKEDKVKVLLYPAYLDGDDFLLNIEFYDVIAGCHLGVFPSYYEPWGYTPLEAGAVGVPAITTDLAGFGRFIKPIVKDFDNDSKGIYVLKREGKTKDECVEELASILFNYSEMTHAQRVKNKIRANELAHLADWKVLGDNYIKAHNLALEK